MVVSIVSEIHAFCMGEVSTIMQRKVAVMLFKQKVEKLLDLQEEVPESIEEEKQNMIQLAVQLILDDISNSKCKLGIAYPAVTAVDIDLLLEG